MRNFKIKFCFVKITKDFFLIGLVRPELKGNLVFFSFLEFSLSSFSSLSPHPRQTLFLSLGSPQFRPPPTAILTGEDHLVELDLRPRRPDPGLAVFADEQLGNVALFPRSPPRLSLFRPPWSFNSPPPAWNHHKHPLTAPICDCWNGCSFI